MTIIALLVSAVACVAWMLAEYRIHDLEHQLDDVRRRYARRGDLLRTAHADIDSLMSLLGEAIASMPDRRTGRRVGEHVNFTAWPEQKKLRLMTDLDLNGDDAS